MADRQINIHAERLMRAGEAVAETLEKAAKPPTGAFPPPVVSSPADIAANAVAASMQAKISALSAELAPAGPQIQAATAHAASVMTATDEENAARTRAVGAQAQAAPYVSGRGPAHPDIQAVTNRFKEGPDQPPQPPDPQIIDITPATGPQAPDPLPPGQTSLTDLNDTTPDWPHVITGDPKGWPDHPMIDGSPLPMKVPDGSRLLPTGIGRDDDGNVIGAFSNPKYDLGTDPGAFITKDTQLWNFTDPKHPVLIGNLPDKSQASVYYNKAEHQWVVVGNDVSPEGIKNGSPRTVWTAPDTPGNSNWMQNLKPGGTVPGGGSCRPALCLARPGRPTACRTARR